MVRTMSHSGTLTRADIDRGLSPGPGVHSSLRELFAPLPELFACGGDPRIDIDPATGRNAYGCAAMPTGDPPGFASCTASTISPRGYEAADRARMALMSSAMLHGLMSCFDARSEALRGELKTLLGIEHGGAEVIFAASGSDAQLTALAISRAVLGDDVTTLIAAADQTGTATAFTTLLVSVGATPPPPTVKSVNVDSITMSWVKASSTAGYITGTVTILDQAGKPAPNAAVTLTASGLVTGTVTAKTNTKGQITVNTPKISSSATGSETYTVTNVVLSGYLYDASKNKVTSATLTR